MSWRGTVRKNIVGSRASFTAVLRRAVRASGRSSRALGVQVGPLAEVHRNTVAGMQCFDGGVRDGGGGVAVPRARAAALPGRARVHPLLDLHVVGAQEPLAPVDRDGRRRTAVSPDDDRAGL